MAEQKYACMVNAVDVDGKRVSLNSSLVSKLNLSNYRELDFSIRNKLSGKDIAFLDIVLSNPRVKNYSPKLVSSGENSAFSIEFFRTFKQSPFRLLLFSSLSLLEKNKINVLVAGNGLFDKGAAHKKQVRQRIITHKKSAAGYNEFFHQLGEFPRLSFEELGKILLSNKPVPLRLLPPESILRKVRAKSFAHLKLKRLGKEKYKAMRKARLAKK